MTNLRTLLALRTWDRHGFVLLVGGLVYIFVGLTAFSIDEISPRRAQSMVIALRMAGLDVWGFVFIFSGLMACLSSRWPTFSNGWGYMVLCGLSAMWSSTYFLGIIFGDSLVEVNVPLGLVWGMMSFLWWAVSGLLNPNQLAEVIDESD